MGDQRSFSFPLLKANDVLQCMQELQIELTGEELAAATPEAVRRVFETVVDICMGVTKDELNQPAAAGLEVLEHGELHEDSIPQLAYFRAVTKLMNVCDIQDFSMKDIVDPDPKRFRRQLSSIINFVKFREDRLLMYTTLSTETDKLMESQQTLRDENEDLRRQLDELKAQAAEDEPAHEQLNVQIEDLEGSIEELNKDQAKQKFEMQGMKKNKKDLTDDIMGVQFELQNVKTEIDDLERQVVHSPRRIKRDITEIQAQLAAEKAEAATLEAQIRDQGTSLAIADKGMQDTAKVQAALQEVEAEFQKCTSTQAVVDDRKSQLTANGAELAEVTSQRQAWKKQLTRLEDKITKNGADSEVKIESAKHALELARSELAEEQSGERQLAEAAAHTDKQLQETQQLIVGEAEAGQKSIVQAVENYKQLQTNVQSYNRKLLGEISNSGC